MGNIQFKGKDQMSIKVLVVTIFSINVNYILHDNLRCHSEF